MARRAHLVGAWPFGEVAFGDPTILEACMEATARPIARMQQQGGDDVVFKLETVLALVAVAQAPDEAQPSVAAQMEFVHAPFAAAAEPPIRDESFYEPLRELALPADTRFIAGFLHESLDTDAHLELLARIERLTGREVDVAAACGLGRRDSDEEAFEEMRETTAILESPALAAS